MLKALLVAVEPSFCTDESALPSPSGFCSRCLRTAGTRWTAAPRVAAVETPPSGPVMDSDRVTGLPRNQSRSA